MYDQLCVDEGCPHYGTKHVCINMNEIPPTCPCDDISEHILEWCYAHLGGVPNERIPYELRKVVEFNRSYFDASEVFIMRVIAE